MKAVKENKIYTVSTNEEAKLYHSRGFDIINDDGTVKSYGAGKTVPYDKYAELEAENKEIRAELEKLKNSKK